MVKKPKLTFNPRRMGEINGEISLISTYESVSKINALTMVLTNTASE